MNQNSSIDAVLACFRKYPRFLITSHSRSDGDAIGSSLALAELLQQLGSETDIVLADPISSYRTLPGIATIRHATTVEPDITPAVVLECDGLQRTGMKGLEGRFLINIDHHASGRAFANVNWIDEHACAVAVMIYQIAVAANCTITPSMATCLYTAILSDTGSFTYASTNAETFAIAHELVTHGADPTQIARDVYFSNSASKIHLLGAALSNLHCEGRIAWTRVTHQDMLRTQASEEDCEGVVNHLISIATVEAAVFLRELPSTSEVRLSLRSKGNLNVAKVAEAFGGGGHRVASGCTLPGPLEAATTRILIKLQAELQAGL